MTRAQFRISSAAGAACLALAIANFVLARANLAAQAEVNARQQYVQQSVQLEGLYRELVRALAELAARGSDEQVRTMLAGHGITYTVNVAASPAAPAASAMPPAGAGKRR